MFTKQGKRVNSFEVVDAFGRRMRRLALAVACSALVASAIAAAAEGRQQVGGRFSRAARIAGLVREAVVQDASGEAGGGCVELATMSVLFEPSATEADVQAYLEAMGDEELAYYITNSVWTQTATDGAVAEGQPMTITYSFVPDGTVIQPATAGAQAGPSNLFATLDANFPGGRSAWKAAFAEMFARWGDLSNITYVEVSDDGAGFPLAPGQLGARGDVRIAMRPLGAGPLARNYYPSFGGDMVLDADDMATFANPTNGFRALRNVLAHEHGHGLGLEHVLPQNGTKLMEPQLNTAFDGPQEDDIRGVQFLYGDWAETNDAPEAATFLGGPLRNAAEGVQVLTAEDVALERDGAADYYAFTALGGVPIAIRVEPVGTAYAFGPQVGGSTTTVDAAATRDLGLRLWRRVSAQNNSFQLMAQINFNPAGEAEYHPPVPYNLAGYLVAEIYATDGVDDVQRYNLTISNASIEPTQAPAALRAFVAGEGTELEYDDTLLFEDTEVGTGSSRTILLMNNGAGELALGNITIEGPAAGDFTFNLVGGATVQPGGQTVLAVSFRPTAVGTRLAVLRIPNNDPQRADFGFIVRGEGLAAAAIEVFVDGERLEPGDELDLGSGLIGATLLRELTVRNAGTATLTISSVQVFGAVAGEFICSVPAASIAPGDSVTGMVAATPAEVGVRQAQFRIVSNDPASANLIAMRAEGLPEITDCNANGTDDAADLAKGHSDDCDANGEPDECQADSDGDGAIDPCDTHPQDPTDGANDEEADADEDELPKAGDPDVAVEGEADVADEGDNADDEGNDNAVDEDVEYTGDEEDNAGDENGGFEDEEDNEAAREFGEEGYVRPAAGLCGVGGAPAALVTLLSLGGVRLAGGRRRP